MSSSAAVSPGFRIAYQAAAVAVLAMLAAGCSSSRFGPDRASTTGAISPQQVYNQPVPPAPIGGGAPQYQPIQPVQQYAVQPNTAVQPITTAALPPAAAPVATPAAAATPTQQGYYVNVVSGDTLYSLSRAYGVSVAAIAGANGLTQTSMLSIGQQLFIPAPGSQGALGTPAAPLGVMPANGAALQQVAAPVATPAVATTQASAVHVVQMGETVYSIARAYGITPNALAAANNMQSIELIQVGQRLVIPGTLAAQPVNVATQPVAIQQPIQAPANSVAAQPAQVAVAPATNVTPQASLSGTRFMWPVDGAHNVLSDFGVKPGGERNDGINLAVPMGTQIHAAEGGVVIYAGNGIAGYGNLILIEHADNWVTAYAHTSNMLVQRDQVVQRGQVIALAGNTGSVSTPQLHFELRRGTQPVNPLDYLN